VDKNSVIERTIIKRSAGLAASIKACAEFLISSLLNRMLAEVSAMEGYTERFGFGDYPVNLLLALIFKNAKVPCV